MTYNNYNHDDYIKQHKYTKLPPFNVGDWVVRICNNQVDKQGLPRKILVDNGFLTNKLVQATLDTYQLWIPREGEWCWFSDNHPNQLPQLGKLCLLFDDGTVKSSDGKWYTYCEPFIGALPTWCKS